MAKSKRVNTYQFVIGYSIKREARIDRFVVTRGTVQEVSRLAAFRKIIGDHASRLCQPEHYCVIVDPSGKSVTLITV